MDYNQTNYSNKKRGWSSWSTGGKVLWVILNIYTCCIPLVIYLIVMALTPEDNYSQINNYQDPGKINNAHYEQDIIEPSPKVANYGGDNKQDSFINVVEGMPSNCVKCGAKIEPNTKFCISCGSPIPNNVGVKVSSDVASKSNGYSNNISNVGNMDNKDSVNNRQQYAGTVLKCPNCGASITNKTYECPECGYEIVGQRASVSIEDFNNKMMQIENMHVVGRHEDREREDKNKSKVALIKTYPIPNSKDDIVEFMIMSYSSINVSMARSNMHDDINEAWVAKMSQCYSKAKMLFPNSREFEEIQRMYIEKMNEIGRSITSNGGV